MFTYLCSEIGETRDVYRFDIEQNDLETASDLFNMFKGAKEKYKTEDKRCKIVDIDAFYSGTHWCVERWWSHAERISLGIEDDIKAVNLSDFRGMLSDVVATLAELDEPLSEIEKNISIDDGIRSFSLTVFSKFVEEMESILKVMSRNTEVYMNCFLAILLASSQILIRMITMCLA